MHLSLRMEVMHFLQPINRGQCRSGGILKKIPKTFQVSTIASFLKMYLFPGKARCAEDIGVCVCVCVWGGRYPADYGVLNAVQLRVIRVKLEVCQIFVSFFSRVASHDDVTKSKNHLSQ